MEPGAVKNWLCARETSQFSHNFPTEKKMASVKKEPALSSSREMPVASQKRSREDFESNNAEPANGNACNNRRAGPQGTGSQSAGPQRAGPQSAVVERICAELEKVPEELFNHVDRIRKSKAATIANVKSFYVIKNSGIPEFREKASSFIAFSNILINPSIGWSKMSWQDQCVLLRQYKSILDNVFLNVYE
jgi:hypothetical protein